MNISAIIPAYNAESTIKRAIDSVLAQSRPSDEIIVIDDGSTDKTAEIVRKYGDVIRYFYQKNTGLSGAMNYGIDKAKGEWIAFLDADDEWLPGLIKSHIKLIAKNPDVKWTYCRHEEVMKNGHPHVQIPQDVEEEIERYGFLSYFYGAMAGFYFGKCGFLIRRSVFDELGNFDSAMPNGMDGDMWRRIALRYPRVAVCEEDQWRYYRDNANSLSQKGAVSRDSQLKSLCRNMRCAIELGPEVVKEYRPYARMMVMDDLILEAGAGRFISPETIEDAKNLFNLTAHERALLRILKLLPKPIAFKLAGRLSL